MLLVQNRRWGITDRTVANIERLRKGASAIVTGQQVVVLGGQLMAFLKALTAIKVAAEQSASGADTVPVFWLATEDHDLAEVSSLDLLDRNYRLHPVHMDATATGAAVGRVTIPDTFLDQLRVIEELFGNSALTQLVNDAYAPGATLADAYGKLFSSLFADHGLILLDATDPELHQIAAPIYKAAAEHASELNQSLQQRAKDLEHSGYHAQVRITNSSTLLFLEEAGVRTPIHRSNGSFVAGERRLTPSELIEIAAKHPERLSGNALLRPVIQDYLLPTSAYVGGPAELAYFAQSAVVYEKLLERVTPFLPRVSASLVEPKIAFRLERYELTVPDVFIPAGDLRQRLAQKRLPAGLNAKVAEAQARQESSEREIEAELSRLDPSLVDSARTSFRKMRYQLSKLSKKAAAAELRRTTEIATHAQQLSNSLYPDGVLQERKIAGIYFLVKYGPELLQTLYRNIQPSCPDHQIFFLD